MSGDTTTSSFCTMGGMMNNYNDDMHKMYRRQLLGKQYNADLQVILPDDHNMHNDIGIESDTTSGGPLEPGIPHNQIHDHDDHNTSSNNNIHNTSSNNINHDNNMNNHQTDHSHHHNMSDMNTPGLVFFLTLPGPEDMMKAFDYMLETAQAVSRNLGGDVLDESRSVVTKQTLEHCRQQIRDLERRMLAKARWTCHAFYAIRGNRAGSRIPAP